MKAGDIAVHTRAVVPVADARDGLEPHLEATEDLVWLSRSQRGYRHTLCGVPARRVDVVIIDGYGVDQSSADAIREGRPSQWCIVEIGRKSGRFDGAKRDRITVRPYVRGYALQMGLMPGRLFLTAQETPGCVSREVRVHMETAEQDGTPLRWSRSYQRLRWAPDPSRAARDVVMWHATRYFPAALRDEAEALASSWTWPVYEGGPRAGQPVTLAEANRSADRALYRMARDAGWRKLTLRERGRLGWTKGPQWRRQDDVLARLVELGHTASGAGDWSRDESTGDVGPAVVVVRRRMERDTSPQCEDVGNA